MLTASQQQYSQGSGHGGPQQSDYDNRGQSYNQQQGGPYGGSSAYPGGDQGQPGPDGERGLGATLVGGGAAGWAAHKAGGGLLSSLAGAAAGAIGANLIEHKFKKHKKDKKNHKDGRPRNYSGDSTSSSDSDSDDDRRRRRRDDDLAYGDRGYDNDRRRREEENLRYGDSRRDDYDRRDDGGYGGHHHGQSNYGGSRW